MAQAHTAKAMKHLAKCGYATGGMAADTRSDRAMVTKGIRQHENHEHGGEHTKLHLAQGGAAKHKKGGTHVNVIVAPQGGGQQPPQRVPVPVPVGGAPGGPPGMGAPPMARPGMPPPGAMPPPGGMPMRPSGMKRGGGVKKRADGGPADNGERYLRSSRMVTFRPTSETEEPQNDKKVRGTDENVTERARGGSAMSAGHDIKPRRKDTPTANKDEYLEHTEAKRGGSIKRMKGGMVPMDAGAGGGEGRLEKIKAYGARPRA